MNNIHVLIIDDDQTSLNVLARLFDSEGITSTTLQDATLLAESLDSIDKVDLVFLDLEMPKLNGYEILQSLRDDFQMDTPVIAYSAYTNEIVEARESGFSGFISKPIKKERFLDQLERILDGKQVWEAD